jgi:hypothetical protein
MDIYSTDFAQVQEGNMRTKAVMMANRAVKEHNDNIGNQIAQLKEGTKSALNSAVFQSTTQQFWASGQLPSKISALQNHLAQGGTLFSNPTTQAQKSALGDLAQPPPADYKPPELTDTGDGIFESSGKTFEEASGTLSSKLGAQALKGLGGATALATGGYDIYEDFAGGKGFHLAGDNWASKASNALQIGGSIADLGGTVFPPLALLGGITDITAGVFGEIGAVKDEDAQVKAEDELKQKETETQQAVATQAPVTTGQVS